MEDKSEIGKLARALDKFAVERDWTQFHTPKNLATALAVEASELLEHFQWLTGTESANVGLDKLEQIEEELADVQIYLIRLADRLGVDLLDAAWRKLKANNRKYPVDKVKGSAKKYSDY